MTRRGSCEYSLPGGYARVFPGCSRRPGLSFRAQREILSLARPPCCDGFDGGGAVRGTPRFLAKISRFARNDMGGDYGKSKKVNWHPTRRWDGGGTRGPQWGGAGAEPGYVSLDFGGGRIRTSEARSATDLQSVPFSHSGTPPRQGQVVNIFGDTAQPISCP